MVHRIIKAIIILVWAVVGLLFWIPLLARISAYYVLMVIVSTYTEADLSGARVALDSAVNFYASGFRKILRSLSEPISPDTPIRPLDTSNLKKVLFEGIYTLFFWTLTLTIVVSILGPTEPVSNREPLSEKTNSLPNNYISVATVQAELDCDGSFTNDQKKVILEKYKDKRVQFKESIRRVEAEDGYILLHGTSLFGWWHLFQDDPKAIPRDSFVFTSIKRGHSYQFDCLIVDYCEDFGPKSLGFGDCIINATSK
jgi:hypothetical protein